MSQPNLRDRSIDELLKNIAGLSAVGTNTQMQSIMAIPAWCTLEITDKMTHLSATIDNAQVQLSIRFNKLNNELSNYRDEMAKASQAASDQSRAMVYWTKALVAVTAVYAIVTALGVFKSCTAW